MYMIEAKVAVVVVVGDPRGNVLSPTSRGKTKNKKGRCPKEPERGKALCFKVCYIGVQKPTSSTSSP